MKIVADENIPLIEHYFGDLGELVLKSGRKIHHQDVVDADLLIVRSVTKVNQHLLENTQVKFVGSTTTGSDHLDTKWLDEAGILWSIAKGCNAKAVVEYIMCVIAALQTQHFLNKKNLRAGVIGVGEIGSQVVKKLKALGFEVMMSDPFREEQEEDFISTSLNEFRNLDLITFHTPLTKTGPYPTYHLIQKDFLSRQEKNSILINTARGEIINSEDLKLYGQDLMWCLDVWENEPFIDLEVLNSAYIATPHIAGYSLQSKYRGIAMIYEAAIKAKVIPKKIKDEISFPEQEIFCSTKDSWQKIVLNIFNPLLLTEKMKKTLVENADAFDQLRKTCGDRYEFDFVIYKSQRKS